MSGWKQATPVCVAIIAGWAVSANASPVYVGQIDVQDSYGSTGGGEFRLEKQPSWTLGNPLRTGTAFEGSVAAAPGKWETFCLERYEFLAGFSVHKADLNTETVADADDPDYAGTLHGGAIDPLDERTAYLYWKFITGGLSSYDYGTGAARIADANSLQMAIWYIEEEATLTELEADAQADAWEAEAAAAVAGGWTGVGTRVFVLNLFTTSTRTERQDLLVAIPLPGPVGMATAGLMSVGFIRRRRPV